MTSEYSHHRRVIARALANLATSQDGTTVVFDYTLDGEAIVLVQSDGDWSHYPNFSGIPDYDISREVGQYTEICYANRDKTESDRDRMSEIAERVRQRLS